MLVGPLDSKCSRDEIGRSDQQQRMMKIAGAVDDLTHFAWLIGVVEKRIRVVRGIKPEQTGAQTRVEQDRRSGSAQTAIGFAHADRRFAEWSRRSLSFP